MDIQQQQLAAAALARLRLRTSSRDQAITDLPLAYRPQSLSEAYAVQAQVTSILENGESGPACGWKIGCTTAVMQAYLNIKHPCAGRLYRDWLYVDHAELVVSDYFFLGLECELAIRLSRDIDAMAGGHNVASVSVAVDTVCTSVEIIEHRFVDFAKANSASLVADDFFSAGCVVGAPVAITEIADLASLRGGFHINGEAPDLTGTGAAILGHPLAALAWLADHAAHVGAPLRAGAIVTLGSVVKTIYPPAGSVIEARFNGLAPVSLKLV
jgi:2-keto-4-pentenoate hydratase